MADPASGPHLARRRLCPGALRLPRIRWWPNQVALVGCLRIDRTVMTCLLDTWRWRV
ncbi:hypothetical protein [Streptomyces sp. HUAS TT7]|uniref:hypothetical protein n=1 Tax=Streptomyces sp. HUAS TT7 TaxID=3447507 RepID=UPI003F65E2FD